MSSDEHAPDIDLDAPDIDLDTVSLLVPKAKEGSDQARAELLEYVQDYVLLMARKNTSRGMQGKFGASDVVQQSLAQVIQGFDNFRGNSASEFYGWLGRIVENEVKQLHRDLRREKRDIARERPLAVDPSGSGAGFVPADQQPTPKSRALAAEEIALFQEALDRLPDDYAEVIRLRSLERKSFKEVAAEMDRSLNSVTKLWYRAILVLQQEFVQDDDAAAR